MEHQATLATQELQERLVLQATADIPEQAGTLATQERADIQGLQGIQATQERQERRATLDTLEHQVLQATLAILE